MRDPNIERLLGGYATNTLTEAERSALFEAALDDQDLFNALQDEEVLRDLLQDADSRGAIERALNQPAPQPRTRWFTPAWAWGLGAGAVAAAALTLLVLSPSKRDHQLDVAVSNPPPTVLSRAADAPAIQSPPPDVPKAAAPVREPSRRLERNKHATVTPPAPEQAAAQIAQQPVAPVKQAQSNDRLSEIAGSAAVQSKLRAPSAAYVADRTRAVDSILYSVLKRGPDGSFARLTPGEDVKTGDSVQLMVRPPMTGSLILQEETPGAVWSTIFPAGAGLPVTENHDVVIPDSPILVSGPRHLRLVLNPAESRGAIVTNLRLGPATSSPAR